MNNYPNEDYKNMLPNQQSQMIPVGQRPTPQQIIYRPPHPQQSMQMVRLRMPRGVPQMQRGKRGRNANTMANSNIQCISGSYTSATSATPSNQQTYRMPQVVGLIVNESTGDNTISYTPSPQYLYRLKFEKLPFYEVIDEIIKPTLLTGIKKFTSPNFPKGSYI